MDVSGKGARVLCFFFSSRRRHTRFDCDWSSDVCSSDLAILLETRPAIMIKSACRGDGRKTSAPKRAMSKRDAPMDIISIAQQAKPNVKGQMEFLRIQFTAESRVVSTTPSGV